MEFELEQIKLERMADEEAERYDKQLTEAILKQRKQHHLLSTQVCRGVYNSPVKPSTEIEDALRSVAPLSKEERTLLETNQRLKYLQTATGIPTKSEDYSPERFEPLPPIRSSVKPQGPFRSPSEVQKQRFKELQPTLRVATDYQSVNKARYNLRDDEWTKRIVDQKFLPSTKTQIQYNPALHTTTNYKRPEYGTKHFRETGNSKLVQTSSFRRAVSPIPLFDQLGKTY